MSDDSRKKRSWLARWWQGWRTALKLGLRESRRHRGRSVLVMILIGVPVLIITAGLTAYGTWQYRADDWAKAGLGSAQAIVRTPYEPAAVTQDPYGNQLGPEGPARPRPGKESNDPWTSADIAALVDGADVAALAHGRLVSFSGPSPVQLRSLMINARSIGDFGPAELVEGRWPAQPGEIVVTDRAVRPGVPRSGPITITVDGVEQQASVVGVVRAPTTALWEVIMSGPVPDQGDSWFLVQRPDPVSWAEVVELNSYGLTVQSRAVMDAAPPYVPPWTGDSLDVEQRTAQTVQLAAISVGILIEVALLAGPAFALGAARQRRIWALIAACGADRRQVRRMVLGQAALLGGAAAVIGAALGLAVSPAVTHLLWWSGAIAYYGSWRPPLPLIGAVIIAAVVSAVIAALGPARAAARRDIASTLNERWEPPAGRRGTSWIGAGLVVLAATAMIIAGTIGHGLGWAWPTVIIACVVLIVGCLMIIPAVVRAWGRVGHRWPVSLRLAARDLGRHRQRSVPAIAAIAAATAVVSGLGIVFASQTALAVRVHTPVTTPGQAVLRTYGSDEEVRHSLDRVRAEFPDWTYLIRDQVSGYVDGDQESLTSLVPLPAGCQESDVVRDLDREDWSAQAPCLTHDDPTSAPLVQDIPAGDRALAPSSSSALRAGKVLVTDPALVVDGKLRLIMVKRTFGDSERSVVTRRVDLPAVVVDPASLVGTLHHTANRLQEPYGWMLPRTADAHQLQRGFERALFGPAGRDITQAEEARIKQLIDPELRLIVERGHVNEFQPPFILFLVPAGLLVLLAAVVATALAQVDGRSEQTTLAAVGAGPAVRRGQAAAQALLLSATGMIFGALAGVVPGTAVALLDQPSAAVAPGPQLAGPWLELSVLIIAASVIAAGIAAWTATSPPLSRRPT